MPSIRRNVDRVNSSRRYIELEDVTAVECDFEVEINREADAKTTVTIKSPQIANLMSSMRSTIREAVTPEGDTIQFTTTWRDNHVAAALFNEIFSTGDLTYWAEQIITSPGNIFSSPGSLVGAFAMPALQNGIKFVLRRPIPKSTAVRTAEEMCSIANQIFVGLSPYTVRGRAEALISLDPLIARLMQIQIPNPPSEER